jgi:hypothetical protein
MFASAELEGMYCTNIYEYIIQFVVVIHTSIIY